MPSKSHAAKFDRDRKWFARAGGIPFPGKSLGIPFFVPKKVFFKIISKKCFFTIFSKKGFFINITKKSIFSQFLPKNIYIQMFSKKNKSAGVNSQERWTQSTTIFILKKTHSNKSKLLLRLCLYYII